MREVASDLFVENTLSGNMEPFEPQISGTVRLYYCGLTVSDDPHLGHARAWIHVDVMDRYLTWLGYDVQHVENFTDVNEKIVARVGEVASSEATVAAHFIDRTIEAMRGLNLKRALVYPRVSEHVSEIIDLIEVLLDTGYAYEANGSVYFDVSAFEDYGKLSNQSLVDIESQGDPDERTEKNSPADFALWKAGQATPDEAPAGGETWTAPWGKGRPGWHIECSAMSMAHLGETIDIHVGGQDLVFPHHENEIAQSEAATGEEFSRYWLHVGLLETDSEKMSSSLENYFTVENALEELGTNVIRMFLLSAAYRSRQSYTEAAIEEARQRWKRLERAYNRITDLADSEQARATVSAPALREAINDARNTFVEAMNDDFDTRWAISSLLELTDAVFEHTEGNGPYDYQALNNSIDLFETFGGDILGFGFDASAQMALTDELIELLLEIRTQEREAGNYDRADTLRSQLESLGVTVEDTDDGTAYRY